MLTALIPPIPELGILPSTGFHLVLSHLLKEQAYAHYYAQRSWDSGDFIILDNNAHEHGVGESMAMLLDQACAIGANEVVLPDVLFDAPGTVEATKRALFYLMSHEGREAYGMAGCPSLMVVPQGQSVSGWGKCLNTLLKLWDQYCPPDSRLTIGVSKDYDETFSTGLDHLMRNYITPVCLRRQDVQVHLLGWPRKLWTLARMQRDFPWVRSTDSAKPYVYARHSILLEPGGTTPPYPRRDPGYFFEAFTPKQREIAARNVEVFKAAAANDLIGPR